MLKRPKKDSVLVKHKKWLADFQKTKERLEEQYLDEMRRKEDSQQKVDFISIERNKKSNHFLNSFFSFKIMKSVCVNYLVVH